MQLQSHSGLASVNRICGFGLTATRIFFCRDRDVRVDLLRQFQVIARRLNALATLPGPPYSINLSLPNVVDSAQPSPSVV